MKTNTTVSLMAVACGLLLSGCAFNKDSNNVGMGIKPLPYEKDEVARITKKAMVSTNSDGGVITFEQTTKTGLEVNSEIQHHRLDMATKVGVAKAKVSSSGQGFFGWLLTPSPYYGNGYSSGGYNNGYYGNNYSSGGRIPTSYGDGGFNYISVSGGGGGPTQPRPNDGGVNYTYH